MTKPDLATLEKTIEKAFDEREKVSAATRGEVREAVETSLELLDKGQARVAERQADGWYESRRETVVYIDREGDGYRALSATCTHLGCRVRWDEAATEFHCPCHGGVYDREGRVVSGPPPTPLARLPVRVNPQTSDIEVEL